MLGILGLVAISASAVAGQPTPQCQAVMPAIAQLQAAITQQQDVVNVDIIKLGTCLTLVPRNPPANYSAKVACAPLQATYDKDEGALVNMKNALASLQQMCN